MQKSFKKEISKSITFNYLLSTPEGYDKEKESLPLIVFLHGAGERGNDPEILKCHSIPKIFQTGHAATCPDLRVITLCPQCPADLVWNTLIHSVVELVDYIIEEYNIDKNRVSVTGISMGGFGTYELATAYPQKFSAVAMCCGGGMEWRADRIAKLPIRLYHGLEDGVVPAERSISVAKALKMEGGNPELILYEGINHDVWDTVYEKTDCIEWLAAQKKA